MTAKFLVSYIVRMEGKDYPDMSNIEIEDFPSKTSSAELTIMLRKAVLNSIKKRYEKSVFVNVRVSTVVILNWWSYNKNYSYKEL